MKTPFLLLSFLCGLSLLLITVTWAQPTGQTGNSTSGSQSTSSPPSPSSNAPATDASIPGVLLSTATLLGSEVRNPQGEDIGDLNHLLIDPHTGRIMYAVITMGAILGMGGETVQVPWETLQVARDGQTFILYAFQPLMPQASAAEDKNSPAPAEHAR